ncbi:hypothetical protein ACWD4V_34300, partial [Streptomyces tsukubensis]
MSSERLDYESPRKSAKVVDTPKGKVERQKAASTGRWIRKSGPETEREKDLVRLETQDRREKPGGPGEKGL